MEETLPMNSAALRRSEIGSTSRMNRMLERDLLPDWLLRIGIRRLLRQRLREEWQPSLAARQNHLRAFIEGLKKSDIAIETKAANEQHYEVPTEFYLLCLGKHLKYSSGWWEPGTKSLDVAEEAMLRLTCERAQLQDGQRILELGCGWGSLSLWMAEHFPRAQITGVSNSRTQKIFIDQRARERDLKNLRIITCDMNQFDIAEKFDRVVSVEMFEHMKNYQRLMANISRWLAPEGKLFVHIFTHRQYAYHFIARDDSDWMARYFFSGGMMPSEELLMHFQDDLEMESFWRVNGMHYAKTARAWLRNMDAHRREILPLFSQTYGPGETTRWWVYWRIFFMACEELWAFDNGREWTVSHYLFKNRNLL